MKPMHQNSYKSERHGRIGRLYWHAIFAEDPSQPWYLRTWESEQNGIRNQRILSIERCYSDKESLIVLYAGPVMIALCWLYK